ncbi:MAG: TerC family protein [Leptospira sp.]|nr:TerC family protein [Leptospira sp.]
MNIQDINKEVLLFLVFNVIIIFMLIIDLGLLSKNKHHTIGVKEAGYRTLVWVSISLLFASFIYFYDTDPGDPNRGETKTMEFLAGYLLEYSLSIDNLFVFIMIFQKFKVTPSFQPEILKWGIIGAVGLRAIMILMGAALVAKFYWILYVFGFFLIYTAYKMFAHKEDEFSDPHDSAIFRFVKKIIPVAHGEHHEHKFFVVEHGKRVATGLLIVLIMIEASDVMFALDSIPAVFSVTQDPFIVYTSNIFAILGLRSLFFMISGIMDLFKHLKTGVSIILAFVGVKMILPLLCELINIEKIHIPIGISLSAIISILATSVLFSLPDYHRKKHAHRKAK